MEGLAATSFDRYARYNYTHRVRTELLGPGPLRILDVGDPYGTLDAIFGEDLTISVDLFAEGPPQHRTHQHLLGSGFQLPFPDASFDLVTAHDVLEHVPDEGRIDFLLELLRVCAGPVVVAAPFGDPRTRACEDIVNAYYVAHVGKSLAPLDEHAENGLPELRRITEGLREHDVDHVVYSDGWLYHWLVFMLLKAHYVSLGAAALDRATDKAFNRILRTVDARAPHYRRALILRPPPNTREVLGVPVVTAARWSEGERAELERLGWEVIQALPWREDPSSPHSSLRRWIASVDERSEALKIVASSLETVLDDARTALREDPGPEPMAAVMAVTAIVVDRGPEAALRALEVLQAIDGVDEVLVCQSSNDAFALDARAEVIFVPGGDDALQIATAAEQVVSEAVLIVDPEIDVRPADIERLLRAFRSDRRCVGFHRARRRAPAAVRRLRVHDGSALYVARELMLVDRDLYRAVGGLDGRFRGQLDDVDFGWRMNLFGHKVTSVGPARWETPIAKAVSPDVAVLWCWIKNLELPTLEQVLARELLVLLGRPIPTDQAKATFGHFEHLLEARAEIARRRIVDDRSLSDRFGELVLADVPAAEGFPPMSLLREALPRSEQPALIAKSVLIVADEVSETRFRALAEILSAEVDVVLAGGALKGSASYATVSAAGRPDLEKLAAHADVMVMPAHLVGRHSPLLAHWDGVLVVDLADAEPFVQEADVLRRGDLFLCASEYQQEHWLSRLLDAGRCNSAYDPADEVVRVVVTPSVPASPPSKTPGDGFAVAIDLEGLPRDDAFVQRAVQDILAWASHYGARADVVGSGAAEGAPGPTAPASESGGASGEGDVADAVRATSLQGADVVVRPTPDVVRTRMGASAYGADPLALGVPLITTFADPVAPLVRKRRAGAVTAADAAALVAQVAAAAADRVALASWRDVAIGGAGVIHDPVALAALMGVVHRPWRWHYAHAGGLIPLSATPAVRQLLERREAEVTASVSEAFLRDQARVIEQSQAAARAAAARLSDQLTATEQALNEARSQLERIRSHPLVRVASFARRLLRSG